MNNGNKLAGVRMEREQEESQIHAGTNEKEHLATSDISALQIVHRQWM